MVLIPSSKPNSIRGEYHSILYQGREPLCSAVLTEVEDFVIMKAIGILTILKVDFKVWGHINEEVVNNDCRAFIL